MSTNTQQLVQLGQSIWLDNITRSLLDDGTLQQYIADLSVSGLTSNPSIFNLAIKNSNSYDTDIAQKVKEGKPVEELFFELAIDDLTRAADLFRPIFERTNGVDGWASLEVSPHLAYDTESTLQAAKQLYEQGGRPNLFIKIPGTPEGIPAIEEAIFAGVPINVTLLFSREQYVAAAEAYLRGIERRVEARLNPSVASVASVFISRWDAPVAKLVPPELNNKLGIAIAQRTYKAYRELLDSDRWMRLANFGARPQRLLWASTGTKDPNASDYLYIKALASPFTINTVPESTLHKFADHGTLDGVLSPAGGTGEQVISQIARYGVDVDALATKLQEDGAEAFVKSWDEMMGVVAGKAEAVQAAGA